MESKMELIKYNFSAETRLDEIIAKYINERL